MDSQIEQLQEKSNDLFLNFEEGDGIIDCLHEAISLDRQALELCPPDHPLRSLVSSLLAIRLWTRYENLGAMEDLDEAIDLDRESLQLRPQGHSRRSASLILLALHLATRYKQLGRTEDLDEAVILGRQGLSLSPPDSPERSATLNNYASILSARYGQLRRMEDLDEAAALVRESLELHPPGTPGRCLPLNNLARYLSYRNEELGVMTDLEAAIDLSREALDLCPPHRPGRSDYLATMGGLLSSRYQMLGNSEDLEEAILITIEALELTPSSHPARSSSLTSLADHLFKRYERLGKIEDLDQAIVLRQDALLLHPPGHPKRSTYLSSLANLFYTRSEQHGSMEDLDQAISLHREALMILPPEHSEWCKTLDNLANCLGTRYQRLNSMEDLDEAIVLTRNALELCPTGHPFRPVTLHNLSTRLMLRYEQLEEIADLNQAIILGQDALELFPPSHPERSLAMNNLAAYVARRYYSLGKLEDLDESIALNRDALELSPPGHFRRWMTLSNLATGLKNRYKELGNMEDLDESIARGRDALALQPPGHPERSTSLQNLVTRLYDRFTQLGRSEDKELMFSLYAELAHASHAVSSSDLPASGEWIRAAENFQHPSTLLAYETCLRFLVQHLMTLPMLRRQLLVVQHIPLPLGADGFSAGIRNGSPTKAVELLEQGRGVFWSQLSRLRFPVDDVIASGPAGEELAGEFKELTSQILDTLDSLDEDEHDELFALDTDLQTVVKNIRELPGLSRFLLPSLFVELQQAATGGPVIVVNASEYGCDALVILLDQEPIHIPLKITQERVKQLVKDLHTSTNHAEKVNATSKLKSLLRALWEDVVSKIVEILQTVCPSQSRIWWCPTAEFSSLPLHAAGPYKDGEQNISDLYISSYTPTLASLIRARRPSPSNPEAKGKNFLAIGQVKAVGHSTPRSVGVELENIRRRIDGRGTFTLIEGKQCTLSGVSEELSKNDWVHLACHALSNKKQPIKSSFALHDGHLTIRRLLQCAPENPEFAFLSDGRTVVVDEKKPDEVIHLASAMLSSGFRSVIGTMWAVDKGAENKIASVFYEQMVDESGRLDHTRAAYALHETMRKLKDLPLDERIAYVHLGA